MRSVYLIFDVSSITVKDEKRRRKNLTRLGLNLVYETHYVSKKQGKTLKNHLQIQLCNRRTYFQVHALLSISQDWGTPDAAHVVRVSDRPRSFQRRPFIHAGKFPLGAAGLHLSNITCLHLPPRCQFEMPPNVLFCCYS